MFRPSPSRERFGVLIEHQEKNACARSHAADVIGNRGLSQQQSIGGFDSRQHLAAWGNGCEDPGMPAVKNYRES